MIMNMSPRAPPLRTSLDNWYSVGPCRIAKRQGTLDSGSTRAADCVETPRPLRSLTSAASNMSAVDFGDLLRHADAAAFPCQVAAGHPHSRIRSRDLPRRDSV